MNENIKLVQLQKNIDALTSQLQMLTDQMERWSQYKMALVEGALYVYEVNLTKNVFIVKQPEMYTDLDLSYECSYTDMVEKACVTRVNLEDAPHVFKAISPDSMLSIYNRGELQMSVEYRRDTPNTKGGWVRFSAYMMKNRKTADICALIIIKNITSQKTEELNLIDKAQHDPLTKLYNRSSMEMLVAEAMKNQNAHHGIIIFDIDNFKTLNDSHGHLFGDKVLIKFSFLLNSVFHKDDIIARIGGDEFLVFATNIEKDILWRRTQEVIEGCAETFPEERLGIKISASIGVALFPEHGISLAQLYPRADAALYRSKEHGKNQATMYVPGMEAANVPVQGLL